MQERSTLKKILSATRNKKETMVTRFVELAATKGNKKGPHGEAQVEIKKAVSKRIVGAELT